MGNKGKKYRDGADNGWSDLPKEIQKSILKAEKQLKDGKGIAHEEVIKKYNKWLKNN